MLRAAQSADGSLSYASKDFDFTRLQQNILFFPAAEDPDDGREEPNLKKWAMDTLQQIALRAREWGSFDTRQVGWFSPEALCYLMLPS
jgi:hypothetical protein